MGYVNLMHYSRLSEMKRYIQLKNAFNDKLSKMKTTLDFLNAVGIDVTPHSITVYNNNKNVILDECYGYRHNDILIVDTVNMSTRAAKTFWTESGANGKFKWHRFHHYIYSKLANENKRIIICYKIKHIPDSIELLCEQNTTEVMLQTTLDSLKTQFPDLFDCFLTKDEILQARSLSKDYVMDRQCLFFNPKRNLHQGPSK